MDRLAGSSRRPSDRRSHAQAATASRAVLDPRGEARLGRAVRAGEQARALLAAGGVAPRAVAELEALVAAGSEAATRLVEANLGLAESIARRFRTPRMSHHDLVQEGAIGLMRAVQRFDPDRGPLPPYAAWWIRDAITKAIADKGRTVRLPMRVSRSVALVRSTETALAAEWGRTPTLLEIADTLGTTADQLRRTLAYATEPLSTSQRVGDRRDAVLGDLVEDRTTPSPTEQVELLLLPQMVAPLLAPLDQRERMVLRLRFGLDRVPTHTLAEIGAVLGLTRQRVGQIEAAALAKMRRSAAAAVLATDPVTA